MRSHPHSLTKIAFWLLLMLGVSQTKIALASPSLNIEKSNDAVSLAENLTAFGKQMAATGNAEVALQLFNQAIQVADTINEKPAQINALANIAIKLAEAGETERSKQLFDRAVQLTRKRDANFTIYDQDTTLRDVVIKVAQAGFTQQGLQLNKTISSRFRQAEALNEIAVILAQKGQIAQARQTLLEALTKARGITGDYAYESNGSCGNDKFDIMSKIAGNLSLLSRFEQALQVAKSVTGCSSANGESWQEYQTIAYLGIMAHLANAAQVKQTWTSAQDMRNDVEKVQIWSAIAVKLAGMEERDLAVTIASKIAKEIPNTTRIDSGTALREFSVKERALRDIAVRLAEVGKIDAAKQVAEMINELAPQEEAELKKNWNMLTKPTVKALTWVEIARQLAKAREFNAALQIVSRLGGGEASALGIIAIAQQLQQANQTSQANRLLSQNLVLPPIPLDNDYAANYSVIRIVDALVNAEYIERGLQLAESINDISYREQALTNIVVKLTEIGKIDQALQIANKLTLAGLKQEAFSKIASKYIEMKRLEEAWEATRNLSDNTKDETLAQIVDGFAKLGQIKRSLEVAQTISSKEMKASAIANIAAKVIKLK